jgi:hypothetical protein
VWNTLSLRDRAPRLTQVPVPALILHRFEGSADRARKGNEIVTEL